MKVEFLAAFNKNISKLSSQQVRKSLRKAIERIESAKSLSEIPNIKKLVGFKDAYRIRLGDYRLGFFSDGSIVQLARIANRKDIYKIFP